MTEALRIQEEGQTESLFLTATCGNCHWMGYVEGPTDLDQAMDCLIRKHHDKRAGCPDNPIFEEFGEEERTTVQASFILVEMQAQPESNQES